jgi:hypothetical protein
MQYEIVKTVVLDAVDETFRKRIVVIEILIVGIGETKTDDDGNDDEVGNLVLEEGTGTYEAHLPEMLSRKDRRKEGKESQEEEGENEIEYILRIIPGKPA